MRTKTLLISSTSALLITGAVLVSCQKKVDLKSTAVVTTSDKAFSKLVNLQDLATAEETDQLAFALDPSLAASVVAAGSCPLPVITYDNPPGVYPRTVTTDWGTAGCVDNAGVSRSGKIMTTYFGDMADTTANSYYIQTYDNYYVTNPAFNRDSVKFEGRLKMKHEPKSQDPQFAYRSTSKDRKVTQLNGDYIITNGYRRISKREDDGGYPHLPQAVKRWYKITGVQTGDIMSGGVSYQFRDSVDRANPVLYKYCEFPVKGNKIIDFTNQSSWFVNYGITTDCDDQAEVTIDGVTTTVTLPLDLL